jgi:hypothetical protein
MEVLSPVGTFPMRVRSARVHGGRLRIGTEMGAWKSEVTIGREDAGLVAACVGGLVAAFLLGRSTGGR